MDNGPLRQSGRSWPPPTAIIYFRGRAADPPGMRGRLGRPDQGCPPVRSVFQILSRVAKQVTRPVRNREARISGPQLT
jgi:hypothetical protein